MKLALAVALGGAAGAVARFLCVRWVTLIHPSSFPYGTLTVNVLGSFVAGLLYALLSERWAAGVAWRALLMTGFLGGFTTFSAFSLETMRLLETGRPLSAGLNVALNLGLCLGACLLGLVAARRLA
jgi:CrcB protein